MWKIISKLWLGSALLIALQACAGIPAMPPPVPTLDPNSIKTAIAGTLAVASTQTAQVAIPITGPSSTPTPTATTTSATQTPTPSLSPTVDLSATPAFTETPSIVQVSVSVATNCRTGPGIAYPRVGGLRVGQTAEVVGRNSDSTFWIIQDPNRPSVECWIWGQFATLTGDPSTVPVATPPPAPAATVTPALTLTPTPMMTSTAPTPSPTPTATP